MLSWHSTGRPTRGTVDVPVDPPEAWEHEAFFVDGGVIYVDAYRQIWHWRDGESQFVVGDGDVARRVAGGSPRALKVNPLYPGSGPRPTLPCHAVVDACDSSECSRV